MVDGWAAFPLHHLWLWLIAVTHLISGLNSLAVTLSRWILLCHPLLGSGAFEYPVVFFLASA